jgi:predicted MFS family arabinose efflux permease
MSINNVLVFLGVTIGAGIGGLVLALFNYTGIFLVFGILILITAAFFFLFTEDPCIAKEPEAIKPKSSKREAKF